MRLSGRNEKDENRHPESEVGLPYVCLPPWGLRAREMKGSVACYALGVGRIVLLSINSICCRVYVGTVTRSGERG